MGTRHPTRAEFLDEHLPVLRRRALFLFGDQRIADDELARTLPRLLRRRPNPDRTLRRATAALIRAAERSSARFIDLPDAISEPREAILAALGHLDVRDKALLADIDPHQLGATLDDKAAARDRLVARLIEAGHNIDGVDAPAQQAAEHDVVPTVRTTDHSLFRRPDSDT